MITAIIATYNGEKYIFDQLDSIRKQTVPVDEVIICDDCSRDNTPAIVEEFIRVHRLEHWHFYINEKNLGPSGNAFNCLTKSNGDIIFMCDQDNIWEPNYVEVMADALNKDPEILWLTALCTYVDKDGELITDRKMTDKIGYCRKMGNNLLVDLPFDTWLGSALIAWCLSCMRKSVRDAVVEEGIPPLHLSIGIDGYTGLIAAVLGKTCQINRPLVRFRVHGANYSLGRLQKPTILSSTNEQRLKMLEQAAEAHRYLLRDKTVAAHITAEKKAKVQAIIDLYERRIRFCKEPRFLRGLGLSCYMNRYYWCCNSICRAIRMWLTDLMYAYGINWKLKRAGPGK